MQTKMKLVEINTDTKLDSVWNSWEDTFKCSAVHMIYILQYVSSPLAIMYILNNAVLHFILGQVMEFFLLSSNFSFKHTLSKHTIFVLEQAVGPGVLQTFSTCAVKQ